MKDITQKIIEAFVAIVVAIVLMQALFQIAAEAIKGVPLWIKAVIISLVAIFVYGARDYIEEMVFK